MPIDSEVKPPELSIPPISDQLLDEWTPKIRPVKELDGRLFYFEDHNPLSQSFTWLETTVEATGLEEVAEITTLHTYGAPSFFKPSIAEVLAQLPAGYLYQASAFKTECVPFDERTEVDHIAAYWGYHRATTTLYRQVA